MPFFTTESTEENDQIEILHEIALVKRSEVLKKFMNHAIKRPKSRNSSRYQFEKEIKTV